MFAVAELYQVLGGGFVDVALGGFAWAGQPGDAARCRDSRARVRVSHDCEHAIGVHELLCDDRGGGAGAFVVDGHNAEPMGSDTATLVHDVHRELGALASHQPVRLVGR